MRRRAPRPLSLTLRALEARLAPSTPLAAIQSRWEAAVGEAVARQAKPVSEHAGVVTVACRSAVWAQELDLMSPQLVEQVNQAIGRPLVRSFRCTATGGG